VKTQSEKWVEDYGAISRISCKRIPEEITKTPDYELTIGDQLIIR
jgi:hypothetical protein